MRKWIVCLVALMTLCCFAATAAGATLNTFTPFADVDFAAQAYMDLITAWEAESGNMVSDYSGLVDESWLSQLRELVAEGGADLLIMPVGSGLTYEQVVTAQELSEAAPELGIRVMSTMAEADGSVLLTPVRMNWEALYVNTDVLASAGLSAPTTVDELIVVCAALSQQGVTPIANALCEWAEIALDCAALIGAPEAAYGSEASLNGAQETLKSLAQVGAFGADPWNMTDADMEALFLSGQAAMRFDTDAFAQRIAAERADSVTVTALSGGTGKLVGSPSFGLAITRACWNDETRREAALSLAKALLSGGNAATLVSPAQGMLGSSVYALTSSATDCVGVLYDQNADGFDAWADGVVAGLMSL